MAHALRLGLWRRVGFNVVELLTTRIGDEPKDPSEVFFRENSKAHQLNEIIGDDDLEPDFFRDHFEAGAKDAIPEREYDAIVTVMLRSAFRVMGSV